MKPFQGFLIEKNGHVRPFAKGVFAICISVISIFTTMRIIAQKTKIVNKKNKKNKIYFIK